MPNALAEETSPYLRQHAENPVDWLPWGPQALDRAARARRAAARLDRLLGLSLVPRDGARVLRGRGDGIGDERGLRMRQGRSRGASGRRRALHGGGTGDDRTRRLAAERLPHPRAAPVLRRHLLSPGRPRPGMPSWTQVLQAIAAAWEENRQEIRAGGERVREQLAGAARLRPSSEPFSDRCARGGRRQSLGESFDSAQGGFGRAPKFPQAPVIEFLLARRRARHRAGDARRDGRRRHPRPARRRAFTATASTPPGPCRTSRRCSMTTRCSRAHIFTAGILGGERRLLEVCLRHARLDARRDAQPGGRLLRARSTPTQRASRDASTCGRSRAHRPARRRRPRGDRLARCLFRGQLHRSSPAGARLERADRPPRPRAPRGRRADAADPRRACSRRARARGSARP